jgi:hypothetical protein
MRTKVVFLLMVLAACGSESAAPSSTENSTCGGGTVTQPTNPSTPTPSNPAQGTNVVQVPCDSGTGPDTSLPTEAGVTDSGDDSGSVSDSGVDSGQDSGVDSGEVIPDSGSVDSGSDAGSCSRKSSLDPVCPVGGRYYECTTGAPSDINCTNYPSTGKGDPGHWCCN